MLFRSLHAKFGSTILTNSTVTSPTLTLGTTSSIAFPSIGTPPTDPNTPTSPIISLTPINPSSPPTSVVTAKDIAKSNYRSTTTMSCDLLKLHKLVENGGDINVIER